MNCMRQKVGYGLVILNVILMMLMVVFLAFIVNSPNSNAATKKLPIPLPTITITVPQLIPTTIVKTVTVTLPPKIITRPGPTQTVFVPQPNKTVTVRPTVTRPAPTVTQTVVKKIPDVIVKHKEDIKIRHQDKIKYRTKEIGIGVVAAFIGAFVAFAGFMIFYYLGNKNHEMKDSTFLLDLKQRLKRKV